MARQNIDINILGTTVSVPMTDGCEAIQELGRSDYVRLDWNSASGVILPAGSTITWQGRSYYLLDPYAPTQVSGREWRYTPQFTSHFFAYSKEPFFFHNATLGTDEPSWKLTGHAADFMAQLVGAMYRADGASYEVVIGNDVTDSYKSLEFNGVDIISACNMVAGAFETEIWLEERGDGMTGVLHLSRAALGEAKQLTISHENDGSVVPGNVHPASVQLNGEYYNRFYVFGSTRNILQGYQGSNVNNLVNKRLTLNPTTYPNGYIDFAQTGERVMSKILIFDEIYPSATDLIIANLTARPRYGLDDDNKVNREDTFCIYYFQLESEEGEPFVFDGSVYDATTNPNGMKLPGLAPMAHFADGSLRGQDFEVTFHEYEEDHDFPQDAADVAPFSLEAGQWWEIHYKEEGTYKIPDMLSLSPNDGDHVVLYNIRMPDGPGYSYVSDAQARLESAALAEINKTYFNTTSRESVDRNIYTLESNPVAFTKSNPGLFVGCAVTLTQGPNDILSTRVLSLRTKLNRPVCQTIEIGNEQVRGAITELKENAVEANKNIDILARIGEINTKITESYERLNQILKNRIADAAGVWLEDKVNLVDGKPSVYLNEKYSGAYTFGFLSAGGVGSGGSGGGGSTDASLIVSDGIATLIVGETTATFYIKSWIDGNLGAAAFKAIGVVAVGNTGLVTGDAVARAIAAASGDANVQSDWNVTDTNSDAYIKNKPDLSVYALASALLNYVTLDTPQTISGQKTFGANVLPASINQTLGDASHYWGGIHFKANGSIYVGTTEIARLQSGLILSKALLPYTAGSDYLGTTERPWLSLSLLRYIYLVRENNGTNESAVLFGRDSSQIYIGSVALSAWGLPMGIYAGEAMNFYVRASGASSPAHVMQLLADKIVARQNLQPLSSNAQDLGASSAIWRNLHAKRWYPNGASGPYIEYDTSVGAFHIAGDLYADGSISAGGRAERDESGILALDALYDHLSASSWSLTSALSTILDEASTRIANGQITGISCSNGEVSEIMNIAEMKVTDDGFITIYFGRSSRLESESGWTYYNSWN